MSIYEPQVAPGLRVWDREHSLCIKQLDVTHWFMDYNSAPLIFFSVTILFLKQAQILFYCLFYI